MQKLTEYLTENFGNNNLLSEIRGNDTNNHCEMVSINETNAKRMLDKHTEFGYIVISPCKGIQWFIDNGYIPDDELNTQRGRDEMNRLNQERIRKMISEIKKSGHTYTPVYGGFIENKGKENEETVFERSFVIYNKDRNGNNLDFSKLYDFGLRMCNDYDQDSFLVQYPDGGPMQYVSASGKVSQTFKGRKTFNDISSEYFTDLHKYHNPRTDSKLTRITLESSIEGIYVNPGPQCYSEGHIRHLNGERFVTHNGFV